jgi:hypothetical protein
MIHPDIERRQDGLRKLGALASACDKLGTSVVALCMGARETLK